MHTNSQIPRFEFRLSGLDYNVRLNQTSPANKERVMRLLSQKKRSENRLVSLEKKRGRAFKHEGQRASSGDKHIILSTVYHMLEASTISSSNSRVNAPNVSKFP